MNPMAWEWKWIFWQVIVPIFGPITISAAVVLAWWSGEQKFLINWHIIVDVSPWALTFYCITLIGATMNDLWPNLSAHPALGVALIIVALAVALYASFIVIWRHDPTFSPGTSVYVVTFMLLAISIPLCHEGTKCRPPSMITNDSSD
jgi:hypothetical protein